MKIQLSKSETEGLVTLRLLSQARGKDAARVQKEIDRLTAERNAIHAEVDAQAERLYAAIADEHGLDMIPAVHSFQKLRDGTSVLAWADPPPQKDDTQKLEELRRRVEERKDELMAAGMTPEQLKEIQETAPLPQVSEEERARLGAANAALALAPAAQG